MIWLLFVPETLLVFVSLVLWIVGWPMVWAAEHILAEAEKLRYWRWRHS